VPGAQVDDVGDLLRQSTEGQFPVGALQVNAGHGTGRRAWEEGCEMSLGASACSVDQDQVSRSPPVQACHGKELRGPDVDGTLVRIWMNLQFQSFEFDWPVP
jgi:hypothetical protein